MIRAQCGPHFLQSAIADWHRIVELNRAVAVAIAKGHTVGLELVDQTESRGGLKTYLLHSVCGDFLQ